MIAATPGLMMLDEVSRFDDAIRRLALDIVAAVFTAELARRAEEEAASRAAAPRPPRGRRRRAAAAAPVAAVAVAAVAPAPAEPAARKRGWTREQVVAELGQWILGGTVVEASFVKRHGAPGLVAAAKKHFGRFEAALNAASLAVAPQAAELRAARKGGLGVSLRALARRQRASAEAETAAAVAAELVGVPVAGPAPAPAA